LKSRATKRFWKLFAALAPQVQKLTQKNYELWQANRNHPSLGFKKLKGGKGGRFSVRVGDHHRALGQMVDDAIEWVWIGSHEEHNKL
jgi:Txe/YoeB family toxin of Txe-Axe toxin-antitoxin module